MDSIDTLIIGTGEYVTGLAPSGMAKSDKSLGVIALTLFDLRQKGVVNEISLAGKNGERFSAIREHFSKNINAFYPDLESSFHAYPKEAEQNPTAYIEAIKRLKKGSAVLIFTPDDTHFVIAKTALEADMHVLIAKPLVKTTAEHLALQAIAKKRNLLCMLEVHKRFDPIYEDAVDQIRSFGDFSYFNSYMSQPKSQLDTFKAWAGISSDISYYLNAHHIDLLVWALEDIATPISVMATASTGVAKKVLKREVEDTITLTVQWKNIKSENLGTSIHTASWIAPKSDVHSQQRFFYMGHSGEINIDQAHRGYTLSSDTVGFKSANPLFMKYTPREGKFVGQEAYGYKSISTFIQSAKALTAKKLTLKELNHLPTIANTLVTTKILEAGRVSLDQNSITLL
jgi:D-galacturonate reductase